MVVLTVDDHPLIRSALREMLYVVAKRIELIEASNPEEGLELLRQRPETDLVFLDLNFSHYEGLAFVERFRAAAPAVPLIIYTMHEDASTLKQALAYGAAGVIPKTHSTSLSAQQWRILELLGQGSPNKEIAKKLGIASNTVKNQLTVIFQKLCVSNRTQAALAAKAIVAARAEAGGRDGSPE
jgi:DNA-binding NarL/FixJ family response regulator